MTQALQEYQPVIDKEVARCKETYAEMKDVLLADANDRQQKNQEIAELKKEKLMVHDWREKKEIDDLIHAVRARMAARNYQGDKVLRKPYFGVLELDDDRLGHLSYCLGKESFFGNAGRILVIDWRDAPISRLYYEYQQGEEYDEDIREQERSGLIKHKLQVEIEQDELRSVSENGLVFSKDQDCKWYQIDKIRKNETTVDSKKDHRLPEITALISPEQFRAITEKHSFTFLLQGGAGSGKTTIGLHRIAYLMFQEPQRFAPEKILVVMFNRSLQTYISGVLPDLHVPDGVHIRTFHNWAGQIFTALKLKVNYSQVRTPREIVRFKKSSIPIVLVTHYIDDLLIKSKEWLMERLTKINDPELEAVQKAVQTADSVAKFIEILKNHHLFNAHLPSSSRNHLRSKLLNRLTDHVYDLHQLFTNDNIFKYLNNSSNDLLPVNEIKHIIQWQQGLKKKNEIEFSDTGILLYLIQKKGISSALLEYAHIMVDEAQDFCAIELATMIMAADDRQSLTICGDMAQKIIEDVSFGTEGGFTEFIKSLQRKRKKENIGVETLTVGYRATRPIMELAWKIIDCRPSMATPKPGEPVEIIHTSGVHDTYGKTAAVLNQYFASHPKTLIGVVCKYKTDADQAFKNLKAEGVNSIRRHERGGFSFQPGIIVTNAHQVKGLEFSAVVLINPAESQYTEKNEDRMLLHVAITRASDRLWIIGHDKMAYNIGTFAPKFI